MRLIDADALKREGWHMTRTVQIDKKTMEMQNRKPTDFPTIDPHDWIPVTEALPEDLEAVNITWVNHEPEPYYHDIKDKNFVATGIHYRDKWYWYSTTCADFLGEYGSNEVEEVDDAVEIIAWMPLPEPYEGEQE